MRRSALALLLVSLPLGTAAAQLPDATTTVAVPAPRFLQWDAGFSWPQFQSASAGGVERLRGLVIGGRLRFTLLPVSVDLAYSQGRLTAYTQGTASRDIVEGSVLASARPLPWLALKVGPVLRAFPAPGGTERWVMWQGRAHADAPLLEGEWLAYGELWVALASSVNVNPGAGGARGAEAGLTVQLPQSPLWARLAYLVDQSSFKSGARTESLQTVVLTVGIVAR